MGEVVHFPTRISAEPFYSRKDIADHLDVSTKTVDRHVARGCPSYKIGRCRRFKLSEVELWLEDTA